MTRVVSRGCRWGGLLLVGLALAGCGRLGYQPETSTLRGDSGQEDSGPGVVVDAGLADSADAGIRPEDAGGLDVLVTDAGTVLVDAGHPSGLPIYRRLCFVDWTVDTVECAKVDGTERQVLASRDVPVDVQVHPVTGDVYWISQGAELIERWSSATGAIETLFSGRRGMIGIALLVERNSLVFTMANSPQLNGGPIGGGEVTALADLTSGSWGIAADEARDTLIWAQRGELWRGNLDGSAASIVASGPWGAVGVGIDVIAQKFYWTADDAIRRANYDGTEQEVVPLSTPSDPVQIAIDARAEKIYWTDQGLRGIAVANLDGSEESLLIGGLVRPDGIALGP